MWCEKFFELLSEGEKLQQACILAEAYAAEYWENEYPELDMTTDSWYLAGDTNSTFSQ